MTTAVTALPNHCSPLTPPNSSSHSTSSAKFSQHRHALYDCSCGPRALVRLIMYMSTERSVRCGMRWARAVALRVALHTTLTHRHRRDQCLTQRPVVDRTDDAMALHTSKWSQWGARGCSAYVSTTRCFGAPIQRIKCSSTTQTNKCSCIPFCVLWVCASTVGHCVPSKGCGQGRNQGDVD